MIRERFLGIWSKLLRKGISANHSGGSRLGQHKRLVPYVRLMESRFRNTGAEILAEKFGDEVVAVSLRAEALASGALYGEVSSL